MVCACPVQFELSAIPNASSHIRESCDYWFCLNVRALRPEIAFSRMKGACAAAVSWAELLLGSPDQPSSELTLGIQQGAAVYV
jgi:hypothetical protein